MDKQMPMLEAVYYGSPVPRGKSELTALGLVFDRIHFPNVSFPEGDVDLEGVAREANRIEAFKLNDYETVLLIAALRAVPHVKDLREFCVFTGDFHSIFGAGADPQAEALVSALEEKLFGPRPEGFIPMRSPASHKGLPGHGEETSLTYAESLFYPAKAIIYAAQHGLPLVNDSGLPVPAVGGAAAKNNAKLLSTLLALECIALALPTVPPLTPREIVELRSELSGSLLPFRASLLRLAGKLNAGIAESATHEDIVDQARFLVETEVQPALLELQDSLAKPTKSMTARAFDVVKHVPTLAAAFTTMDKSLAIAHVMASIGAILTEHQGSSAKTAAARSPMYYLLRLQQVAGARRV